MGLPLNLHLVLVIVGAIVGEGLAGVIGLLLARFAYRGLLDLPPWEAPVDDPAPLPQSSRWGRACREDETPPEASGVNAPPSSALLCRPALPADKDQALAFLRWTWEGEDYLPQVWDDWLADPAGLFVAAELRGRVVGLGRLTDLGEGEAWLEGLRVDPELQGRGIASRIHDFLLERWRSSPSTVVRLATASTREAVHRLCKRTGFEKVANLVDVSAHAAPGGHRYSALASGEAAAPFQRWEETHLGRALGGLLELHWQWARLSPRRLSGLAAEGMACTWNAGRGGIVATRQMSEEEQCLRLHAVAAEGSELVPLLHEARCLAAALGLPEVRWRAPADEAWEALLREAGFEPRWPMTLFVFERPR